MRIIALGAFAATALLASAASAAPLNATAIGSAEVANVDQVRLVCNEYGRCFRTAGRATSSATTATTMATWCAGATDTTAAPATTIAGTAITAAGRASASASAPAAGNCTTKGRPWGRPFRLGANPERRQIDLDGTYRGPRPHAPVRAARPAFHHASADWN